MGLTGRNTTKIVFNLSSCSYKSDNSSKSFLRFEFAKPQNKIFEMGANQSTPSRSTGDAEQQQAAAVDAQNFGTASPPIRRSLSTQAARTQNLDIQHAMQGRPPLRRSARIEAARLARETPNRAGPPMQIQVYPAVVEQIPAAKAAPDSDEEEAEPQPINIECPICKMCMLNRRPVAMVCGHLFCSSCIERALTLKKECPLCRQFLTTDQPFINVHLQ